MEVSCAKRFKVTCDELNDGIAVHVSDLTTVDELYDVIHNRIYECFKHYNLKYYNIGLWDVCEYLVTTLPQSIMLHIEIDVDIGCVFIRI